MVKKRSNTWRAIGARVLNRPPRRYLEALAVIKWRWPEMGLTWQKMYALEAYRGMCCLSNWLAPGLPSYQGQGYRRYAPLRKEHVTLIWIMWRDRLRPATVVKWHNIARAL